MFSGRSCPAPFIDMGRPINVLIDTDIGTDIDDAIALVLAAKSGAVRLAGVTTVSGNAVMRAKIATHLLRLCGYAQIPVAAGAGGTCSDAPCQFFPDKMLHYCVGADAVSLILEKARELDNLMIITLGALTNIASCMKKDPVTMQKAELYIMGGMVGRAFPEGNIATDPEAARIVFDSPIRKTLFPLDVTTRCNFSAELIERVFHTKQEPNHTLYQMFDCWKRDVLVPILKGWGEEVDAETLRASAGLHDPMTVAGLLWPDLFHFRSTCVRVEIEGQYGRGLTLEQVNPFRQNEPVERSILVADDVDTVGFLERLTSVLQGEQPYQYKVKEY